MVKRKGVTLIVDENFFKKFESERQREQVRISQRTGGIFNLTQRNFTAMLAAKNFKFDFPKRPRRIIKRRINK